MDQNSKVFYIMSMIQAIVMPALCFIKIMGNKATRTQVYKFRIFGVLFFSTS